MEPEPSETTALALVTLALGSDGAVSSLLPVAEREAWRRLTQRLSGSVGESQLREILRAQLTEAFGSWPRRDALDPSWLDELLSGESPRLRTALGFLIGASEQTTTSEESPIQRWLRQWVTRHLGGDATWPPNSMITQRIVSLERARRWRFVRLVGDRLFPEIAAASALEPAAADSGVSLRRALFLVLHRPLQTLLQASDVALSQGGIVLGLAQFRDSNGDRQLTALSLPKPSGELLLDVAHGASALGAAVEPLCRALRKQIRTMEADRA